MLSVYFESYVSGVDLLIASRTGSKTVNGITENNYLSLINTILLVISHTNGHITLTAGCENGYAAYNPSTIVHLEVSVG